MKQARTCWGQLAGLLAACAPWCGWAQQDMPPVSSWRETAFGRVVAERLVVGTRFFVFRMAESDRASFVGTINHLGAVQDIMPTRVYADWFFHPNWGMELAWDRMRARTKTTPHGYSDGDFLFGGPLIGAVVRGRSGRPARPYAVAGLAFFSSDFEPQGWWEFDYGNPEEWHKRGDPQFTASGQVQELVTDDHSPGVSLAAGCEVRLTENISLDACLRYIRFETEVMHPIYINGRLVQDKGPYTVPLSTYGLGIGLRHLF